MNNNIAYQTPREGSKVLQGKDLETEGEYMGITAERYIGAIASNDLGMSDRQVKHIDLILAWGLSANEMGKVLLRLRTQWDGNEIKMSGDANSVQSIVLRDLPKAQAGLVHWLKGKKVANPEDLAARAIYTWLDNRCGKCKGSGERILNGKALICTACKGAKLRTAPSDEAIKSCHQFMNDCIARAVSWAGKRLYG